MRVPDLLHSMMAQYAVGSNKDMSQSSRILAGHPGAERGSHSPDAAACSIPCQPYGAHFSDCYVLQPEYWMEHNQANKDGHTFSLRDNASSLTASCS